MTPEFKKLIEDYPDLSEDNLKLIYIRDLARKSYVERNFDPANLELANELSIIGTIKECKSDDDIRTHIHNLEKARQYLSAAIQGYRKAWEEKLTPEFKAKNEREKTLEKVKKSSKSNAVADLVAKLLAQNESLTKQIADCQPTVQAPTIKKEVCSKCNAQVFSLKFHKC